MRKRKRFLLSYKLYNKYNHRVNNYAHVVIGHTKRYYEKALRKLGATNIIINELKGVK